MWWFLFIRCVEETVGVLLGIAEDRVFSFVVFSGFFVCFVVFGFSVVLFVCFGFGRFCSYIGLVFYRS